jgi:AcrR family transcriptional regulator
MARTKADNFDDIRETILKAAAKLFASKGFNNTNIIDIGQACGASKSRMYHYFPSKDAMLEEMLMQHIGGLVTLASKIAHDSAPTDVALKAYIFMHLKYYYEGRDRHTVLIEDAGCLSEQAQQKLREAELTLMNFMASLLVRLNPQKFSAKHLASTYAMLIYGMLNWTYTWYKPSGKLSLDVLADEAADFCLNGVSPRLSDV